MKILRLIIIAAVVALLVYGLKWESRTVRFLDGEETAPVDGPGFIRGATGDRYLRQEGILYDTRGRAGNASKSASIDDCPT